MAQVKVGNTWLATIGAVGELTWSTVADGGCEEASWTMPLSDTFTHPSLRTGQPVVIYFGSASLWCGLLAEPNVSEDGWKFTAIGYHDDLYTGYICFDASLNTTSTPNTAIDQAIARGGSLLPLTRPASFSSSPFAAQDQTDNLNYVGDLLDAWANANSVRWRINGDATITAAADPTTPTWFMTPGSARIGLADDDYASNIYLRYKTAAASYATVAVADATAGAKRRREYPVDATTLGVTTSGAVANIGNGMLAKGKARYAWTDGVTPARLQLTTPGGQPACLALVDAGDLVRTFGVINEQGTVLPYFDWVIGHAEYTDGEDTISLAPTSLAARNLSDILSLAVS